MQELSTGSKWMAQDCHAKASGAMTSRVMSPPHIQTLPASVSVEAQDSPVAVDSGSLNLMPTETETRLKLTQ